MSTILHIKSLHVTTGQKTIISDLDFIMPKGEIHLIMGPNGSGKSTLCQTIMGNPHYAVRAEAVEFMDKNILDQKTDERARSGIFLAFQYPREIPGISFFHMLRTAFSAHYPKSEKKRSDLKKEMIVTMKNMGLSEEFGKRAVNENASGGEKKRLEMVQLSILQPKLAILDEIDSGVDIDARKSIAQEIMRLNKEEHISFLIITHDQQILKYIQPHQVHIMKNGKIVASGGTEMVTKIEQAGYESF